MVQDFQATVEYNLISHEEGGVVLKLLDAERGPLASSKVLAVQQGRGEIELMIASTELPEEGPVFLRAELRDDTSAKIEESEDVIFPLIHSHIEVTQVIQNTSNTVPLVAGKRTVARVYVTAVGAPDGSEAQVELEGFRNGSLGTLSKTTTILPTEEGFPSLGTRSQLNASANFVLPPDWVQSGDLELRATALEKAVLVEFKQRQALRVAYFEGCFLGPSEEDHLELQCPSPRISGAATFARKIFPVSELSYLWLPTRIEGGSNIGRALLLSAAVIEEKRADIVFLWTRGLPFLGAHLRDSRCCRIKESF